MRRTVFLILLVGVTQYGFGQKPELVLQTGHSNSVWSVAFSPDGKLFASGSHDGSVKIWDLQSRQELRSFKGNSHRIWCVTFSPDGNFLAAGGGVFIDIFNIATGRVTKTFNGHQDVLSLAFSPKGETLAVGDWSDTLNIWNIKTGEKVNSFRNGNSVWSVAFSPDGNTLASGGDNKVIKLWDLTQNKEMLTLSGHKDSVKSVSFSQKGNVLATASKDGIIKFWDYKKGTEIGSMNDPGGVTAITFSPNGQTLASANFDGKIILWDVTHVKKIKSFSSHDDAVLSVAFSPDGKFLVDGSADSSINLWDIKTGQKLINFGEYTGRINTSAFSPDGKLLVTGGVDDSIWLWNLDDFQIPQLFAKHSNSVTSVAFSSDSKWIASHGGDSTVRIWDIKSRQEIRNFKVAVDRVSRNIVYSPDGNLIAIEYFGGDALKEIWDVNNGQKIKFDRLPDWVKFPYKVINTEFRGNKIQGQMAFGRINIIEPETKKLIIELIPFGDNGWLVVSPQGFFDGTPNAWKQLIWRFNNNTFDYAPVETYFNDFFYPNLLQDVLAGKSPQAKAGSELEKIDRRQPKVEILSVNGQTKEQVANRVLGDKRTLSVAVEVADNAAEKKQTTQATATSGAQDLRLFRNGLLVKVWHGDVFALGKSDGCEQIRKTNDVRRVRCSFDVPLVAGENNFSAYAFNSSNVKSNDDVVSIKGAESLKRKGTLYVLAVGVNDYQGISKLKYAVDDARDLGAELQKQQQKLQNYASTEVITLTDAEATKENILLAMKRFRTDATKELLQNAPKQLERIKPLQPEDALLISFSGHGVADGERFYLLPQDYNSSKLKESSVSDIELNEILEKVDAGQLLLIIDACQSGQALGQDKEGRGPMNSKGLAQLAYDKGMYILTASQSYQAAFEVSRTLTGKDIKHGLLSFALLEALTTNKAVDANGNVLDRNWFNYAVEEVPRMQLEEMKKRQGKGSELLFVNNDNKNIEAERRRVQTPRIFYRREESQNPFIVAKP